VSEENVKLAHDLIGAYDRGGIEAALEYFDPEGELVTPPEWMEDRVMRGHDGMRKIQADWDEQFDDFRVDPGRIIDAGENGVVALFTQRGRMKRTDHELEQPVGFHFEFFGGKVTRSHVYLSWDEALAAVGMEA
jgi:ketosteroid isomerase-like protein